MEAKGDDQAGGGAGDGAVTACRRHERGGGGGEQQPGRCLFHGNACVVRAETERETGSGAGGRRWERGRGWSPLSCGQTGHARLTEKSANSRIILLPTCLYCYLCYEDAVCEHDNFFCVFLPLWLCFSRVNLYYRATIGTSLKGQCHEIFCFWFFS